MGKEAAIGVGVPKGVAWYLSVLSLIWGKYILVFKGKLTVKTNSALKKINWLYF